MGGGDGGRAWGQENRLPCSNTTDGHGSKYIDLLMYGANDVKGIMRDELAKISYELKAFKHCFRSVQWLAKGGTTHAVATPQFTLGIGRCTASQMFFKVKGGRALGSIIVSAQACWTTHSSTLVWSGDPC